MSSALIHQDKWKCCNSFHRQFRPNCMPSNRMNNKCDVGALTYPVRTRFYPFFSLLLQTLTSLSLSLFSVSVCAFFDYFSFQVPHLFCPLPPARPLPRSRTSFLLPIPIALKAIASPVSCNWVDKRRFSFLLCFARLCWCKSIWQCYRCDLLGLKHQIPRWFALWKGGLHRRSFNWSIFEGINIQVSNRQLRSISMFDMGARWGNFASRFQMANQYFASVVDDGESEFGHPCTFTNSVTQVVAKALRNGQRNASSPFRRPVATTATATAPATATTNNNTNNNNTNNNTAMITNSEWFHWWNQQWNIDGTWLISMAYFWKCSEEEERVESSWSRVGVWWPLAIYLMASGAAKSISPSWLIRWYISWTQTINQW